MKGPFLIMGLLHFIFLTLSIDLDFAWTITWTWGAFESEAADYQL